MCNHINIGSGNDLSIKELAENIKQIIGFMGEIKFDSTKLEGSPRKFLDIKRIENLGFKPKISLEEGLIKTYQDYLANINGNI